MNCTKTVVAVGQWPSGRRPQKQRPPILFPEYKRQMADVIRNFKNAKTDIGFHLRSIHYNPLGDTKFNCPPDDWRSPSTIDGYKLECKYVPYIDTNFILRPMWDSASDWCHYKNKVGSFVHSTTTNRSANSFVELENMPQNTKSTKCRNRFAHALLLLRTVKMRM
jgi:hypothetical protein